MGAAVNYDLEKSRRYIDMMQKVEDALIDKPKLLGDEEQLIIECHALSVAIENEMGLIHNFIREKYGLKVGGELDADPIDYARAVKRIDLNSVVGDLEGVLPSDSDIIMVLACWLLGKTIEACDRVVALDSAKKKVMDFVQSRMAYVAPNLCALVGSAVAAQLMNTAGGLSRLGKSPGCHVLFFGAKRKKNSAAQFQFPFRDLGGYIEQSEIIQSYPFLSSSLRRQVCRLLAAKSTLAARMDSLRAYPTGECGTILKESIIRVATKFSYRIFLQ